uniref:Uncharacterized protein n=1 Tax=Oryza rufipogon TaxID=4529 RepID=A0A0E0NQG7_ORYRU
MDADKVVEEKDCGIPGVLGAVEFDLNEQRLVVINVPMAVSDAEEVRITAAVVVGAKATEEGAVGSDEAALTRANSRGRRRGRPYYPSLCPLFYNSKMAAGPRHWNSLVVANFSKR